MFYVYSIILHLFIFHFILVLFLQIFSTRKYFDVSMILTEKFACSFKTSITEIKNNIIFKAVEFVLV